MKRKLTLIKLLSLLMAVMIFAGNQLLATEKIDVLSPRETIVDKTHATGEVPAIINDAGATRGAGFNKDYVFVASRQNGNHVYFWDIANPGNPPDELDITGVAGGVFTFADLTVVESHIFASNMVFSGEFKVYHWDGVDAVPSVFLTYNSPVRMGDAFTVIGNPETEAYLIASGHGTKNIYVWEIMNGAVVDMANPEVYDINLGESAFANFTRVTMTPDGYALISGPSAGVAIIEDDNEDFTMEALVNISPDFFPGWPMYVNIFNYKEVRVLAYVSVTDNGSNVLYLVNISNGADDLEALQNLAAGEFAANVIYSVDLGTVTNGNASVSLDVTHDQYGNILVHAFSAGNGFLVQKIGNSLTEIFTLPFVETFDGEGETTPDTWLPNGWTAKDEDGDTFNWYWSAGPSETPNGQMRSESAYYNEESETYVALTPDNWLITPAIILDNLVEGQTIKLTFGVGTGANTPAYKQENYEVLISTTSVETDSYTMLWEETIGQDWVKDSLYVRNLDLSAYAGETVYLAFRHVDVTDMDRLLFDNVSVEVVTETQPEPLFYSISFALPASTVNYKYFVVADAPSWDMGEWPGDPNRSFEVTGDATVEDVWGVQPEPAAMVSTNNKNGLFVVTFKVDMAEAMVGEVAFDPEVHSVFIAGSFGGAYEWNQPGSNPELEMKVGNTGVVSVNEAEQVAGTSLFPNPARETFSIVSPFAMQQIIISDLTGRTIKSINASGFEQHISTQNLNNGIYIVSVISENGSTIKKLQIQK
jgi:hypothetical protein